MRWILLCILVLAGCGSRTVVLRDDWRGTLAVHTTAHEVYRDQFAIVEVRPVVVTSDQGAAFAVLTNVRRRDANEPRIVRMTSGDTLLRYTRHDRLRTHCIDGCQKAEVGAIHLSRKAFVIAASTGLPLRIWGQRGRYGGVVPAHAFADALSRLADVR